MGQHHIRAIARIPERGRVVAVADPSAEARERVKTIVPGVATYSTPDELLAREQIDLVHVVTAPHTHASLARLAIGTGCHVYVEKPFVETAREAEELLALARARGVAVCAGHQLLTEESAREALALLPMIGDVVHVESYFAFRPVRRMRDGRVPLRPDLQLLDILPHPTYLLLSFLEKAASGTTTLTALDIGPRGTVHGLVRRGRVSGTLTVTLDGRPVDSYVRVVGTNGTLHADFVRGTVQRYIGPGSSGVDKALQPYRAARQLFGGTTAALARRVRNREASYAGLRPLIEAFYKSVASGDALPMTGDSILETVRLCERVAASLAKPAATRTPLASTPDVCVTGGTGFLGKEVVQALVDAGSSVRVLARRAPAPWEEIPGADYVVVDLGESLDAATLRGAHTVIHCAAETAGGWEAHQRNSLDAAEHLLTAAAAAGVARVIHVSSLGVMAESTGAAVSESSPVHADSRAVGPYVWGKLESERLVQKRAAELELDVRIVRPAALIDEAHFEPPGRLGKRLGNIFVAVGGRREQIGVVDVAFSGRLLAWMATHFDEAPGMLNLLAPNLPSRRDLVTLLRRSNPDLTVVWLPRALLAPLSWFAIGLQKVLRPGKPAINVGKVFASQRYDNALSAQIATRMTSVDTRSKPADLPALV
jgi:predicted dehydrogenase/nucleoside-diphosphate-sugar epimerase